MPSYFLLDRAIVRLTPTAPDEDVAEFLQGLVTNDVMQDGPAYTALLTPQGKVLFDFFVEAEWVPIKNTSMREPGFRKSGDYLIDCEATQADALVKRLSVYRLRRKIEIKVDPHYRVWWESEDWHDGWPDVRLPNLGHRGLSRPEDGLLPALGRRLLGVAKDKYPDGSAEFRKRRLSLGVTEGIAELGNGETLWLECNAAELNGVSFNKGCYVGQENTARMNWRQKVNRRLFVLPIDQADPKRTRIAYPELGLAVVHMRIEDVALQLWPAWLPVVQD
jgi:folate-binding protein YgfZ